ncbi:Zinc finger, C3HC4 type (RING finger) containing protein [Novymonas esmeraldas]|uniref:Zinc finger, C3HC4 type (RING finger) containing protein n=1 Tax=Novymonas esmeraldas TaxID=1808958 RepID=A0AAW0EP67_9TRYP
MSSSDGVEPRLPAPRAVPRYVRTLEVYPVAPPPKTLAAAPQQLPPSCGSVSLTRGRCCAHGASCHSPHGWASSCIHGAARASATAAAAAKTMASGASLTSPATSSSARTPVVEADYRLSPEEVQRRAQQALTAQMRRLLEARLQERLREARAAKDQWDAAAAAAARRPSPPPHPTTAPADPSSPSVRHSVIDPSRDAAPDSVVEPLVGVPEPTLEEVPPFQTTALLAHRGVGRGAPSTATRTGAAAEGSASTETSIIDAHPYSAVELVRVHRLKGLPKHNRGLFAGLAKRSYITRSGQYAVGSGSDLLSRVRPGVAGHLWDSRRGTCSSAGAPPRLAMRSICTDSQVLFQWTEDFDSVYAPEEGGGGFGRESVSSQGAGADGSPLGHALKGMLEHTYGRSLTAEQRAEAARRLREKRGDGGSGSESGAYSSPMAGSTTDSSRHGSWFSGVRGGSASYGEDSMRRSPHAGRDAHGRGESGGRHGIVVVQDLSPTEQELEQNLSILADTPTYSSGARGHGTMLNLAAPAARGSASGESSRHRSTGRSGESAQHGPSVGLSLSSLGHTLTANEAEEHRRRRRSQVGFAELSARSRSSDGDGPSAAHVGDGGDGGDGSDGGKRGGPGARGGPLSAPGSCSGTGLGSASRPSMATTTGPGDDHRRLSNTACLDTAAEVGAGKDALATTSAGAAVAGDDDAPGAAAADGGSGAGGGGGYRGRGGAKATRDELFAGTTAGASNAAERVAALLRQRRTSAPTSLESSTAALAAADGDAVLLEDYDEEHRNLNDFLTHFPEEEDHVRLRRTAKNILDGLDDMWDEGEGGSGSFPLPKFLNPNFQFPGLEDFVAAGDGAEGRSGHGDGSAADRDEAEPLTGFGVDEAQLNEKFKKEAEEECASLVAQRDALLVEVEIQRQQLRDFAADVNYLSVGQARRRVTAEQYAIELTGEVNRYAKAHRLRLNRTMESTAAQQQQQAGADEGQAAAEDESAVDHVARGFLDRFGRERAATADVGCQVCDADLSYVDAAVRSTEEQLEDLFLHEKALVNAVRLATVAVANIMTFHASLEMESTCRECFFVFDKPRTLWPCGHTFCLSCLSNMYNKRGELVCAECGSVCEVGYTPNVSVELIANYQTVCRHGEVDHDDPAAGPASTLTKDNEPRTIEGVLRSLLNDLLSTQSSWTAMAAESTRPKLLGAV